MIAAANSVTHCIFSRQKGLLARCHWLCRLTCVFDRNFCLFIQDQAVALVCNGFETGQHAAGTGRDETTDDDVFLQPFQRIGSCRATAASVSTLVVSWNDAAEMNERVCSWLW